MVPVFLAALAFAAVQAIGDEPSLRPACTSYVGTTLQPVTIDAAILQLGKVPKAKGEYETTTQFAARQAGASAVGPLLIAAPVDLRYVRYDADTQRLNIGSYALDNRNVSYDSVFGYGTPYYGKVTYGAFGNIDVVISEREGATGSYVGHNAMGAQARVTKLGRVTKVIFDREAEPEHSNLFEEEGPNHIVDSLMIGAADARALKPRLSAAFVVYPKWPYVASGTKNWGDVTIAAPQDVRQRITVLVADIQCALLLDGTKVLAAFATK